MNEPINPLPEDVAAEQVVSMFDLGNAEWVVTAPGDYQTAAAEAMRYDGSGLQRVVILEWPGRVNNSDELRTMRLVMAPEDAAGLADVLRHTARWLIAAELRGHL